jgi:hypothetical protein
MFVSKLSSQKNNKIKCNIYCLIKRGFGNKVFDIITMLYLKYKYKCNIYILLHLSKHNSKNDPHISHIFPNLKKNINFISYNQYNKIKDNKKTKTLWGNDFETISDLPQNLDGTYIFRNTYKMYKFITIMYYEFKDKMFKNAFYINRNLISKNILKLSTENYICVHIRYGDKFKIAIREYKNTTSVKNTSFIIYKPEYYIDLINFFSLKKNLPIYIVSDSNSLVKKYILPYVKNKRVKLLDIPYWDAFYLMNHSLYSVLSFSTFGLLASIFNPKLKLSIILDRPKDDIGYIPEDELIPLEKMYVINNKKLILNYDIKMLKKMNKNF